MMFELSCLSLQISMFAHLLPISDSKYVTFEYHLLKYVILLRFSYQILNFKQRPETDTSRTILLPENLKIGHILTYQ